MRSGPGECRLDAGRQGEERWGSWSRAACIRLCPALLPLERWAAALPRRLVSFSRGPPANSLRCRLVQNRQNSHVSSVPSSVGGLRTKLAASYRNGDEAPACRTGVR